MTFVHSSQRSVSLDEIERILARGVLSRYQGNDWPSTPKVECEHSLGIGHLTGLSI
jgi:hypothetical protein